MKNETTIRVGPKCDRSVEALGRHFNIRNMIDASITATTWGVGRNVSNIMLSHTNVTAAYIACSIITRSISARQWLTADNFSTLQIISIILL